MVGVDRRGSEIGRVSKRLAFVFECRNEGKEREKKKDILWFFVMRGAYGHDEALFLLMRTRARGIHLHEACERTALRHEAGRRMREGKSGLIGWAGRRGLVVLRMAFFLV